MLMAKGHRSGGARDNRLFEMSIQSALVELNDHEFDNEDRMHRLIEGNIQTLFPDLAFLTREFREMAGGELRPDTVALDTSLNTFVALEYKNRQNTEAVDQARTYLNYMARNKADLVLLHSDKKGSPRSKGSFDWKAMYAIIMAPEFGAYQISGADKDSTVELYKIRIYDNRLMMMERVGGGHGRTRTTPDSSTKSRRTPATAGIRYPARGTRQTDYDAEVEPRGGYTSLPDIGHVSGSMPPGELARPDGSKVSLGSWTGVLAGVADWLVTRGHLDESHCPVVSGQKNAILNTKPVHQNGNRFRYYRKAGHLYVFLNASPDTAIRYSIKLIRIAGLDPSDFAVSFGDSNRPARQKAPPPMSARVTIARGSSMHDCEGTNECFVPHAVTVGVGGKVEWFNADVAAHAVTSGSLDGGHDGVFNSNPLAPETKFSHRFRMAGEYPYFDPVHPRMQGVVVVKDRWTG